jgi:hypothetical protein
MKFAFKIETELATQAAMIVAIFAFSSGSLAMIVIYANSPTISTFCAVVFAIVIYLELRLLQG